MDLGALTLLPPVAAIAIAIWTRNVYVALIAALFLSETLMAGYNPGVGALGVIDRTVAVFEGTGNTMILLFCLLIGALIAFMRDSGGVAAMARGMISSGIAGTRRRAEMAVAGTGAAIFIETNVSLLSGGILGRPLYDAHGLSRERLAYVIDSTSAPISVLILLNAWGAYALGLVEPFGYASPLGVVMGSIPLNFYALLTLALVVFTAISGRTFGPMRKADSQARPMADEDAGPATGKPRYMWIPLCLMIASALIFMGWTGWPNLPPEADGSPWPLKAVQALSEGDGSRAILWAITLSVFAAGIMLRAEKVFSGKELQSKAFSGIGEMIPLVTVLLLSIALGASLRALGTGTYAAGIAAETLPGFAVPAILFAVAAATSFMTGTSWGTYGILVPIAMPLAQALGIPPSLALAAVLGGGVFGDHCSPISDTTLIASVAAGSDHLSHVKTQLPYALLAAGGAIAAYLLAGVFMTG